MTNPLDNSDLASLIQADWHEEFGDIDYANEIRESVLEPQINNWHWSDEVDPDSVGGVAVGGEANNAGSGCIGGAGAASVNVGIGGPYFDTVNDDSYIGVVGAGRK